MTMPFDTLAFAQRLETAGMNRLQSEALANALRDVAMPDLATKSDLNDAVNRLTIRMGGMAAGSIGLVAALVALFARLHT